VQEEQRMPDEKRETVPIDSIQATLSTVFREEAGKLVGALLRILGNFEVAEEIVQDALLVALEHWPIEGIPARPGAWLLTVARRRALDQLRRDAHYHDKLALLEHALVAEPDDRLRLMFTCCHPALSREAQVVLTLRAVCGFTTAQIAHTFLASESAIAKRLVRARQKIVQAGIPYRVPRAEELDERLGEVLAVLYLMFNEGYLASTGGAPMHRDLAEDATWLVAFVTRLYPREPEALGLLALMRLHLARVDARFDAQGKLILLADQDRSRWDRQVIRDAGRLIEQAAALGHPLLSDKREHCPAARKPCLYSDRAVCRTLAGSAGGDEAELLPGSAVSDERNRALYADWCQ
jgi:RNA polymerase sigma factor (sigma-70 family)